MGQIATSLSPDLHLAIVPLFLSTVFNAESQYLQQRGMKENPYI